MVCILFKDHLNYETFLTENEVLIFISLFSFARWWIIAVVFFLLSHALKNYFERHSLRLETIKKCVFLSLYLSLNTYRYIQQADIFIQF